MRKKSKIDIGVILLSQFIFWAGLAVACFAKELGLPKSAPRTIFIIYGVVLASSIVGGLIYGGVLLGLQWSQSLLEEHGSRFKVLLLLPGYVFLAGLVWLIFALGSRYLPESAALPLIALLLTPGVMIGFLIGLIKGRGK
jgi:hypothetical protein